MPVEETRLCIDAPHVEGDPNFVPRLATQGDVLKSVDIEALPSGFETMNIAVHGVIPPFSTVT